MLFATQPQQHSSANHNDWKPLQHNNLDDLIVLSTQEKLKAKKVDEGEALKCLIEHKNDDDDMDAKCQASIEHFQLVSIIRS